MKTIARYTGILLVLWPSLLFSQAAGDYRSFLSGPWSTATNWQTFDGITWITAATAPSSTNGVITIQSGHTMQITANVTIDQVVIDAGGTINWTGGNCIFANGAGVDLLINGTFWDNRGATTPGITFNAGATWQMGANGTLVRSAGNSAVNWQSSYEGGIANIPATSFWILRKTGTQNPALATTTPATGSVYPNLIIENNTATAYGVSFTGSTANATIKGNFNIGGSGSGTGIITFTNSVTYVNPLTVAGNLVVQNNHVYQNYGTGTQIGGDLTVNGSITYDANDGRKLIFYGSSLQDISGTGTLGIYDMLVNKTGGSLTLSRPITIDNLLTFSSGIIYSTATNLLTLNTNASVTGATNISFVDGPVRYKGSNAITFPVGKGSDLQPIGISAGTPDNVFWTETFSNGCANACFAPYTGPNGTWSITLTGTNEAQSNKWYISGAECGNAPGDCGTGCGSTDPSLHIGPDDGLVANDGGARYDAGGLCGLLGICVITDVRCESPTIDCSLYSGFNLSFNYIENGQGTTDNATLWYFDGSTWSLLADMPKTPTGCSGGQGLWTNYTIAMPASANNNPNVKIGFRWVNNATTGTDPSIAIDDVEMIVPGPVSDFTAEYFHDNPQVPYGNTLASPLTTLSSCEYWMLNRNAGTESKFVTLTWDANSCPVTDLSTLRVARYDGAGTWQNEGNMVTTGTTAAGTITSNMVSNFSPFTLADVTVLPIQLLDFKANYDGTNVNCTWITASELNNDYFTLERTTNGKDYKEIGYIKGSGTTNIQHNYNFPDCQPLTGQSYYRLKQTDFNGQYTYSQWEPIHIGEKPGIHIDFVGQAQGQVEFNYTLAGEKTTWLTVYDMTGKVLHSSMIHGHKLSIDKSLWAKGVYTVMITNGKEADQRKFAIE